MTACRGLGRCSRFTQNLPDPPTTDARIARLAERLGLTVVSKNEDFLRLHSGRFALVWLRCGNITHRSLRT